MKKLILILSISFAISGCSPDENIDTSNNCKCGEIIEAIHVIRNQTHRTSLKVVNNCSGKIYIFDIQGTVGNVGEQFCHE